MKKNELKVYILELCLIIVLFFAFFVRDIFTRNVLALFLFLYMLIVRFCLKKRTIFSMYKKQANMMMILFALLYLGLFYFIGIFSGFKMSKVLFSFKTIITIILPLVVIIVSSEEIRKIFLAQRILFKKRNMSILFSYIAMVLIDLVVYINIYDLYSLEAFWEMLGYVVFASLSCNLLYNYISSRFGSIGIIIYRLITSLYVYIIPIVPDVYIFFESFFRLLYPYLIYIVFENKYVGRDYIVSLVEKKKSFVVNISLVVGMTLIIMLVSCRFKYGILVVGSGSMRNTIDIGDVIMYKSYDGETIKNGQVIVFNYNGVNTIHRVVDIRNYNGEYRFYTKGDANSRVDTEYRIKEDITGIVKLKVKYIGYPTLWVNRLFS